MKPSFLFSFSHSILSIFAVCCSALILLLNCVYLCEVSYDEYEKVSISVSPALFQLFILLLILFSLLFIQQKICRKRLNSSKLFLMLSFLYIACGIYLIASSDHTLRADAEAVFSSALNVINNDYSSLWHGCYMHTHPHQLGLMFYDLQLARIFPSPVFLFSINLVWVLGINFITWQISCELFNEPAIHQLTILICFCFVPQFFFILFAYGTIPGFFFMILSFYQTLVFSRTHRWSSFIIFLLSASIAVTLKKNYLIGILAQVVFLVLQSMKTKNLRVALLLPVMLLPMLAPNCIIHYFEKKAETPITSPLPSILYVAMGTDIDNSLRGPGWYDSSITQTYRDYQFDTEASAAAGWEKISENLSKIQSRPHDAFIFFRDKIISQWCDPLYQSIWSGPHTDTEQCTQTTLIQDLYSGGTSEDIVTYLCRMLMLLIWSGALYFLICSRCGSKNWELAYIYFLGGFLFHIVWEAKSQYIYTYVFCLIPFAAHSIYYVYHKMICIWNRFSSLR